MEAELSGPEDGDYCKSIKKKGGTRQMRERGERRLGKLLYGCCHARGRGV